jgi:hypothetical protein
MSGADDNFISRWSKRKIAARSGAPVEEAKVPPAAAPAAAANPVEAGTPGQPEASVLPPVESLTPESDFTPFMKGDVDPGIKREALKTLFRDPRFNVMDGLDVYIDDYSKPDPLPPEWLGQLNQMKYLGAYVEEPEKAAEEAEGEAAPASQKAMPEQPVADAPADTASEESNGVSVTESPKSGGTLPRNEA